jgi:hypothetical protein
MNRWNYVEANPINYQDPSGEVRCPWGWGEKDVKLRVDTAEWYISGYTTGPGNRIMDPVNTYTAAGIAIQCAGTDIRKPWDPKNSGVGLAQVSDNQVETEWGKPFYLRDMSGEVVIEDGKPVVRGYGLRLSCPDTGELEEVHDPKDPKWAVEFMRRRIQLVIDHCGAKCTSTDKYIAAALAQNGPGFTHVDIQNEVRKSSPRNTKKYSITKDWLDYFDRDSKDGNMVNTKTQLFRFTLIIKELRNRSWYVPNIYWNTVDVLQNW